MEITCEKGEHVILTDNCGQIFQGFVKSVNQELGRIVLSDIVKLPENKIITGYRNFDKNEILELRKFEEDEIRNAQVVGGEEVKEIEKLSCTLSESEIQGIRELQRDYCYIKDFDGKFQCAIAELKSCKKVGFFGIHMEKGRCGRASVLVFSTPSAIFVFDLQTLGDNVFDGGLREVLESSEIVKVVHDCRLLSDCLAHKHMVSLEGIRDVEAEDIMVVHQERQMIRKHSRSLEYLIKVYLGVDIDKIDDSSDLWTVRPLSTNLLEAVVCLASFLIPLQEVIERKYLQRLIQASSLYNTHVRNMDFFGFLHQEPSKTLRKEILKLNFPHAQARGDYVKYRPQ